MSVTLALVFAYARGTLCMSIYHFETFSNVISHFLIKVTVAVARLNRNATSPLPLGHCPVNCEQSKQFVNIMGVKLGR
ncbi:peroxisomal,Citrate synthase [Trichinella spiralis]|uniref:Peroxisomal,Citrate synthase n=1 Tax=Trichinella spiralis TaxID=6334 RepID=A0ABR3K6V7_TRISP